MIVKMKRIAVAGMTRHSESVLHNLRKAGCVHISHVNQPEGPVLENLADRIFLTETALQNLLSHKISNSAQVPPLQPDKPDNNLIVPDKNFDINPAVDRIVAISEQLEAGEDELMQLKQEIDQTSFIGPFNSDDIAFLHEKGIEIALYRMPKKEHAVFPKTCAKVTIGESPQRELVIAVARFKPENKLTIDEYPLPSRSVEQVRARKTEVEMHCQEMRNELAEYAALLPAIKMHLAGLKSSFDFEMVRAGMGSAEEIVYLSGYCPANRVHLLREAAHENSWGLLIREPGPDEEPPTLVHNPAWIRIIRPVFNLLNTVPGYRELDISGWFLIFFSIFFGMIIGDAGYGIIFLSATIFFLKKYGAKAKSKDPFYLMILLSSATIVWGAVSGNWFGVEQLTALEPFRSLIIPQLNAYTLEAQDLVMSICFYLAAIHLSLAHVLVIINDLRLTKALANSGWIMMVWVMFFVARSQVLGYPLPFLFNYLLGAAGVLIIVFTVLDRSQNKGIAEKLIADIILASINTFADTISYIRLFAVGLATLAVAQSFNAIAMQVGFGTFVAAFGAALILIIGHLLNIALAAMAVIVHGIRLNMLEFSSHVGNTWSGFEYDPFK